MTTAEEIRKRGYLIAPEVEDAIRRKLTVAQYNALVDWDPHNTHSQKALTSLENILFSGYADWVLNPIRAFVKTKKEALAKSLLPSDVATELLEKDRPTEKLITTSKQFDCVMCNSSLIPGLLLNAHIGWNVEKQISELRPITPHNAQCTTVTICGHCKLFNSNDAATIFLARLLGVTPKFDFGPVVAEPGSVFDYNYVPMSLEDIKKALGK